jgi:biopolymer transport protein ExbD
MKLVRHHRPGPYIPFITLADIAWQIIIFFLVASTFVSNLSLTVALPSATISPEKAIDKPIRIDAGESTLAVNGMPVPLADLELQLRGLLAGAVSEDQRAVVVFPADDLSFQRNGDILYAIQQAGGVVLISEERRDETRTPAN